MSYALPPYASDSQTARSLQDMLAPNRKANYLHQLDVTKTKAREISRCITCLKNDVQEVDVQLSFRPGKLGISSEEAERGTVRVMALDKGGQAEENGVQVGWTVKKFDDMDVWVLPAEIQGNHSITFCRHAEDSENQAVRGKLLFLSLQASAYEFILELLIKNHAALELKDSRLHLELSESQRKDMDDFYKNATELLVAISSSFHAAMAAEPDLCTRIYEEFQGIFKNHPWKIASALASGGLVGGANAFGNWHLFGWLPFEISKHLGFKLAVCSTTTGVVTALILVAAIAIVEFGAYIIKDTMSSEEDDAVQAQKELNHAIDQLKENPLPLNELIELRNTYERAYVWPLKTPTADSQCVVCKEGFPMFGCNHCEAPERAPGCRQAHFVHRKCLTEWTAKSNSLKCTLCRQ